MKWQAYPKYKDSGVEWLGEIPAHWEIAPLKYLTTCLDGKRIPLNAEDRAGRQGPYPYWGANGVVDHIDDWLFDEELVLLGEDGAPFFDSYKDVAFVVKGKIWVNNHIHVLRPKNSANPNFLAQCLNVVNYGLFIEGSTRDKLTQGKMNDIPIQYPPLDEQRVIAAFLDRETERIDALIARKERQIELLQEKRAALISHAVTKGLDPNAPVKDSGIEWLGEIPAHWRVCLFKRVADTTYGMSGELDRTLTEGTRILSLPNVNIEGNLVLDEVPFAHMSDEQKPELLLRYGDLLFNWRNGSSSHLGKTAFFHLLAGEYTHVSFLLRLRFASDKHDSRYFHRMLNGLRITGFFSSSKAGVNNTFNQSEVNNLWVMVPPLKEQKDIADYLNRETGSIDKLLKKVQKSIAKLHEYRTALISAAVTGKIDVRP